MQDMNAVKPNHIYEQSSVMASRDLVSVSRLVSRPIVASLGLEAFRSRLGLDAFGSRLGL